MSRIVLEKGDSNVNKSKEGGRSDTGSHYQFIMITSYVWS